MRTRSAPALVAVATFLTACGSDGTLDVQTRGGTTALVWANDDSGMDALLEGVVVIGDGGCLGVVIDGSDEYSLVAWPEGSRLSEDGQSIDVPDAGAVRMGQPVSVGGGGVDIAGNEALVAVPDACATAGYVFDSHQVTSR